MSDERFRDVTVADLAGALAAAGVRPGATVYVAASLAALAHVPDAPARVLAAIDEAVTPAGTVVMPSGSVSFREHGVFDREHTPSRNGILSEAFRVAPGVTRTWAPPFNTVCARGRDAARVTAIESATAFGPDSVFQHLIDIEATAVLLGCSFHDGVAHVHWLEERHDVPYRRWVDVTGVVVLDGERSVRTFPCHVRAPGVVVDAGPVGDHLAAGGHVTTVDVGLLRIEAFCLGRFADVLDPWFAGRPGVMVAAG